MGKTALGTNKASQRRAGLKRRELQSGRRGHIPRSPVLFFSLEMAAQQLSARILSEQSELKCGRSATASSAKSEREKFVLTMQDLSNPCRSISTTAAASPSPRSPLAPRRMKREKNIGFIIIDYPQLVELSRCHDNRVQEITEVTKGLLDLAKSSTYRCRQAPQRSAAADARDDKRPVLSDLRESGSIETGCSTVMFVYREEYYSNRPRAANPSQVKPEQRQMDAGKSWSAPPTAP